MTIKFILNSNPRINNTMLKYLREYGYSSVWNDKVSIRADGGPICAGEIDFQFKFWTNVVFIALNAILLMKSRKAHFYIFNKKKVYLIEYLLALVSVIMLVYQVYFKVNSKSLVFLFNPCHLSCVG